MKESLIAVVQRVSNAIALIEWKSVKTTADKQILNALESSLDMMAYLYNRNETLEAENEALRKTIAIYNNK